MTVAVEGLAAHPSLLRRIVVHPRTLTLVTILVVAAVWEIAGRRAALGVTTLVPLTSVLPYLVEQVAAGAWWSDIARTLWVFAAASGLGMPIGLLLGALMWRWDLVGQLLHPLLIGALAVPLILFYPVTLAVFGLGPWSIILIAALTASIPMALNSWAALCSMSATFRKVARVYCGGWRRRWGSVYMPAAAPILLTGVRVGMVLGYIAVIGMEFLVADAGLGNEVKVGYRFFQPNRMFAAMVLIMAIAVPINYGLMAIERAVRRELHVS